MIDKETLVKAYEDVLVLLLNNKVDEFKAHINHADFSHMTLSYELWDVNDMYWNIWDKEGANAYQSSNGALFNGEFIVLSDFEFEDEVEGWEDAVTKLQDIFESLNGEDENEDEDEEYDQDKEDEVNEAHSLLIELTHETLALAVKSDKVQPLLLAMFSENSALKDIPFENLVYVNEPDGTNGSGYNFLSQI